MGGPPREPGRGRRARSGRLQPVPPRPRPAREHDRSSHHRRGADVAAAAGPQPGPLSEPGTVPPGDETPGDADAEAEAPPRQTTPFLVLQFFVFPMAIVAVCVTVFVIFGLVAGESRGAKEYLSEVRSGGASHRWQAAFELSKVLQSTRTRPSRTRSSRSRSWPSSATRRTTTRGCVATWPWRWAASRTRARCRC